MNTLAVILLIYFIGYVISYLTCKHYRTLSNQNKWEDVIMTLGYSSLSWIMIIFLIIELYIDLDKFLPNKPPKWM